MTNNISISGSHRRSIGVYSSQMKCSTPEITTPEIAAHVYVVHSYVCTNSSRPEWKSLHLSEYQVTGRERFRGFVSVKWG